jgi:hypothetical protein
MKSEVFYTEEYHYRRLRFLLPALVMTPLGIFCSWRLFPEWLSAFRSPMKFIFGLLPISICGIFTCIGIMLLWNYFSNRTVSLIIDSGGVTYAGRHFPWSDISSLRGVQFRSHIQLLLHRRGRIALDRHLQTDKGLSEDEFQGLMVQLQKSVTSVHPHLRFI